MNFQNNKMIIKRYSSEVSGVVKRYFKTDTNVFQLPSEFVNSKQKYIHIFNVFVQDVETNKLLLDVTLHSNIVDEFKHLDSMIMFCNKDPVRIPKYEQLNTNKRKLTFWFKNLEGKIINPDSLRFIIEGMLEYTN